MKCTCTYCYCNDIDLGWGYWSNQLRRRLNEHVCVLIYPPLKSAWQIHDLNQCNCNLVVQYMHNDFVAHIEIILKRM